MKRSLCVALLMLAVASFAGPARAQLVDKTTISFSFADDNLLRDPGETRRNSPEAYFGQQGISALDRVEDSAYRRNESRLNVQKKFDLGDWKPEGGLKLRFGPDSDGKYNFRDDGTFIRLNYVPSDSVAAWLMLYPIDSDKLRLGFHYDTSWGGSNVFPKNFRKGLVPAAQLGLKAGPFDGYIGMKTALIRSPSEVQLDNPGGNTNQFVERAYYGALAGLGVEMVKGLRLDVNGGFFEKGTNTKPGVLGKPITSGGASAQLSYRFGGEVGKKLDLRLYMENPDVAPMPEEKLYSNEMGFEVALEGTALVQTLADPDHYGSTRNEWSKSAYFSAAFRQNKLRIHVDAIYRDLSYIVFNVPGFDPYNALLEDADLNPEIFGSISVDYYIEALGLTPALTFGVLLPSTFKPTVSGLKLEGPYAEEIGKGLQKVVVRGTNAGDWDILPVGEDQLPVFMVKLDLKFNLGQNFFVNGEVSYGRDPNFAQVQLDERGHAVREFDKPDNMGVGLITEFSF